MTFSRSVIIEEFCIASEDAGCVQLTFTTGRDLGDGAGFVATKDGSKFASYTGVNETKAVVPGYCDFSCESDEHQFDILIFSDREFPTIVNSSEELGLWSSISNKLPGIRSPVLIQRCLEKTKDMERFTVYRRDSVEADGSYLVYLDKEEVVSQTFDIGASQVFKIPLNMSVGGVITNVAARCSMADQNNTCELCEVCSEGMAVNVGKSINIGGFQSVKCSIL